MRAARAAKIREPAGCQALRHSVAGHLLKMDTTVAPFQELLAHASVTTTMIYTHVLQQIAGGVRSPIDTLIIEGRK